MTKLGLYLLLLLFSSHMIVSTTSQSTTDPGPAAATNFIKSSCQVTLYPALCFHCLSNTATTIQKSPKKLAQAALSVSLDRAQSTAYYVSTMTSVSGLPSREYQAIKDCISTIGDCTSLLKKSIHELDQIGRSTNQDFMLHVSDVQTWVSAAETNLNTCVDGFSSKDTKGDVKDAIKSRVTDAMQVTSNALALVNRFVAPQSALGYQQTEPQSVSAAGASTTTFVRTITRCRPITHRRIQRLCLKIPAGRFKCWTSPPKTLMNRLISFLPSVTLSLPDQAMRTREKNQGKMQKSSW